MIIQRWFAQLPPEKDILKSLMLNSYQEVTEESLDPTKKIQEHKHPLTEVRLIISGEMLISIAGNQVLLRAGDKIEIPANTKHFKQNNGKEICISLVSFRMN